MVVYGKEEILAWTEDLKMDFNQVGSIAIRNSQNVFQIHTVPVPKFDQRKRVIIYVSGFGSWSAQT